MVPEFLDLIHRDHCEIDLELARLVSTSTSPDDLRSSLDTIVLGLTAHAEAEMIALRPLECSGPLQTLISEIDAEHLTQERALSALICAPLGSACSRQRAEDLRELVRHHAAKEERFLPAAVRAHAGPEAYLALAAAYATERLRQFAMLHAPDVLDEPAEASRI
ncbi:MAG: hypothetical protein SFX73_27185 [Kofleriaceae bacterium]|nr:hypothetical protein [Kofleriaceae bacterium]